MSNDIDKFNSAASGYLLSSWLPIGDIRKILFVALLIFGAYGVFNASHWYHYVAIAVSALMSPKLVGLTAYYVGKVKGFFSIFTNK